MPLQNRVQPDGEIIAHPARGQFMGNRGILHGGDKRLGPARWRHKAWVTCLLSFKDRHRRVMTPGNYTELFFHDEAVAFAAGHRPCGECRRADYNRFRDAAGVRGKISDYDDLLHTDRAVPRVWHQVRHRADISDLPDGTFIFDDTETPALVWDDMLLPFAPSGYGRPQTRRNAGRVTVLTPRRLLDVLRAGYVPQIALPA